MYNYTKGTIGFRVVGYSGVTFAKRTDVRYHSNCAVTHKNGILRVGDYSRVEVTRG